MTANSQYSVRWALLLVFSILQASAVTFDEVITSHIKAIGGEKAFKECKSRVVKGVIQIKALGLNGAITIFSKAPDKQLSTIQLKGIGEIREGFDGKTAWSQNPLTGLIVKSGSDLDQARIQADFYRDIEWGNRYRRTEYKGLVKLNNRDVHVIIGFMEGQNSETHYVDAETYFIVRMDTVMETEKGVMKLVSAMSDFRNVDGMTLPFNIELIEPKQAAFSVKIDKIQHNQPMANAIFEKPKS